MTDDYGPPVTSDAELFDIEDRAIAHRARLSHERGADAGLRRFMEYMHENVQRHPPDGPWNRRADFYELSDEACEAIFHAAERALSVPAPLQSQGIAAQQGGSLARTLPALDAVTEAAQAVVDAAAYNHVSTVLRPSINKLREALRDAEVTRPSFGQQWDKYK